MTTRIFVVAGEASGDEAAAEVLRQLERQTGPLEVVGLCGPALRRLGARVIARAEEVQVVGLWEAIVRLPSLLNTLQHLKQDISRHPPDLALLVDLPDINLRLAPLLRRKNVPLLQYISPQFWAWRAGRLRTIRRLIDHVAVILPFEEPLYRRAGVSASFVGHPLVQRVEPRPASPLALRQQLGLPLAAPLLALLPGSRPSEIKGLLPPLLQTFALLRQHLPQLQAAIPLAPTLVATNGPEAPTLLSAEEDAVPLAPTLATANSPGTSAGAFTEAPPHGISQDGNSCHDGTSSGAFTEIPPLPPGVHLLEGEAVSLLRCADAAVIAAGTATLEAALAACPAVVVYRLHPLSFWLAQRLVRVPFVALPNLLLNQPIYPEFLQDRCHPPLLAQALLPLLTSERARRQQQQALSPLRPLLGQRAAPHETARLACQLLHQKFLRA